MKLFLRFLREFRLGHFVYSCRCTLPVLDLHQVAIEFTVLLNTKRSKDLCLENYKIRSINNNGNYYYSGMGPIRQRKIHLKAVILSFALVCAHTYFFRY